MALTRPIRSPSQPKRSPPAAAEEEERCDDSHPMLHETFVDDHIRDLHVLQAGRATSGKMPISMPSNIQPRKAATKAIHLPFPAMDSCELVVIGIAVEIIGEPARRRRQD